jgi:hypothetical protein
LKLSERPEELETWPLGAPKRRYSARFGPSIPTKSTLRGCSHPFSNRFLTLDFSHLGTKGVGYARHQSPLEEVIELRTLPPKRVQALAPFAPLFSERVFRHA